MKLKQNRDLLAEMPCGDLAKSLWSRGARLFALLVLGVMLAVSGSDAATFVETGGTLALDLGSSEPVTITSTGGPSYTFFLSSGTWGGTDSGNVIGNGTTTLTVTTAGTGVFTQINVTDSGATSSVTFADSGANAYLANFTITLDSVAASPALIFNGTSSFGSSSLTATVDNGILVSSGAIVQSTSGNLDLEGNWSTVTSGNFIGVKVDGGTIQSTGTGTVTVNGKGGDDPSGSQHGIQVRNGGVVQGGTGGTLTVQGTGGGSSGDASFGVYLTDGGSAVTSLGANVQVTGLGGGAGSSSQNYGVLVANVSQLTAGGSATVTVLGTGGAGSGNSHVGVFVTDTGATITSGGGNVQVTGQGGGTGGSGSDYGVRVSGAGTITAGGSGTVTVQGTAGSGSGNDQEGVFVRDGSSTITSSGGAVQVTGLGGGSGTSGGSHGVNVSNGAGVSVPGSGAMTVQGTGGAGSGDSSFGVYVTDGGSTVGSGSGTIQITGTGGGTGASKQGYGVIVANAAQVAGGASATVIVQGTGGPGSGSSNFGVFVTDSSSTITSSGGNVQVTGTEGGGASGIAIVGQTASAITTTGTGAVALTGDSMSFDGSVPISAQSGGSVTLKQKTAGVGIDLGSGSDPIGGPLSLSNTELGELSGGAVVIGDANAGAITISASLTPPAYNLTLTNNSTVTFNNSLTLSANENLTVNAASTVSFGASGAAVSSGTGTVSMTTPFNISLASGSSITTVSGGITLNANQQATPSSGNFEGIVVRGATVQATGNGVVTVNGRGGDNAGGAQNGVDVGNGGMISGGTSGTMTVLGTGGGSSGSQNFGVLVSGSGSTITSGGANVQITGQGGGSGGSDTDIGAFANNGGTMTAGGSGSVTVMGTGAASSGDSNHGVVSSGSGAAITSSGGNVIITGIGGGSGTAGNALGVVAVSSSVMTAGGSGTVTIQGTGGTGTGAGNYGVSISGSGSKMTSGGGAVQITGIEGSGTSGIAIVGASSGSFTTFTSGGTLTLIGDSMSFDGTVTIKAQAGSSVTLKQNTAGVAINVGSASDPIGGPLGLSATEIADVTAGTINIGDTSSGTVTVSAQISRATSTALVVKTASGNNIAFSGNAFLNANGGSITLSTPIGGTGAITSGTSTRDLVGGTITLTAGSGGIGASGNPLLFLSGGVSLSTTSSGNQFLGAIGTVSLTSASAGVNTVELDSGTFNLASSDVIDDLTSINVNGGTLGMGGNSDTVAQVTLTTGTISGSGGTLTSTAVILAQIGTVSAKLGGSAGLTEGSGGSVTLSGANTYTGATTVGGSLFVNGSTASGSAVTVQSTGTLGGIGTVNGNVLVQSGGTLLPGPNVSTPAIINTGNVTFNSGSTFTIDVSGSTAGTGYDQLNVTGTVSLGNATLSPSGTITSSPGQTLIIINNDGGDAITGTFNGLPEGSLVTVNGVNFFITYIGGDGNDVALVEGNTDIYIDTSGNLIIADGEANDDTLTIQSDTTNNKYVIQDPNLILTTGIGGATGSGTHTVNVPFAALTGTQISVNTGSGNDSLTVDLSLGNFSKAISFDGGTHTTTDTLVLTGGTFASVAHTYTGAAAGSVAITGNSTISYVNTQQLTDNLTGTARTFNLPSGGSVATLADDGTGGNTISRLNSSPVTFVQTDFKNPGSSATFSTGNSADTLSVTALPDFDANLTIGSSLNPFSSVTVSGAVALTGSHAATIITSAGMTFTAGLSTVDGAINLKANQGGSATSGTFAGITVNGATVQATGTGVVTMNGKSGTGATSDQDGIFVEGGGVISGGTSGTMILTGAVGNATGGTDSGIRVTGTSSTITSSGANVQLNGSSSASGSSNGGGIAVDHGGLVTAGGTATVSVTGTAAGSSGNNNIGITVQNSARITSTGGSVTLMGTGGAGTGSGNHGVSTFDGGVIDAGGATSTVMVTGIGGTGTDNEGVNISSQTANFSRISSAGGDVTVNGTPGSPGVGIKVVDSNSSITTSTNGGNIALISDSMAFAGAVAANGSSTVNLLEKTATTQINVGGADSAGVLGLSTVDLGNVTAGTIQIGDTSSGAITISAAITRGSSTALSLTTASGQNIVFSGVGSLNANGGSITLSTASGGSGAITSGTAAADITGGTIALTAGSGGIGGSANPLVISGTSLSTTTGGNGAQFLSAAGSISLTSASLGSGTIELDAGTFNIAGADAVNTSASLNVNGGTFGLSTHDQHLAGVQLTGGTITGTSGILTGASDFDVRSGSASAILAGSTGTIGLAKTTGGTVTLTGTDTYSGTTTVGAGTLTVSSIANSATVNVTGGILQQGAANALDSGATLTLSNVSGATFDLNGLASTISVLSGGGTTGGNVSLNGGTLTASSGTFNGIIQDGTTTGGGLTTAGAGTLTLTGLNTYTGTTTVGGTGTLVVKSIIDSPTVNINSGTLQQSAANALDSVAVVTFANASAFLDLNGFALTIGTLNGGGGTGGDVNLNGGTLTVSTGTYAGVIQDGVIINGGLIKTSASTLVLNGSSTYTGSTAINAGTIQAGVNNALPATTPLTLANVASAILDLQNFTQTIKSLAGGGATGGNVYLGSGTLTVSGSTPANDTTYSGVISDGTNGGDGTGGILTKTGTSQLTLTATSTYTGNTDVTGGTLLLAATANITTSADTVVTGTGNLKGTGATGVLHVNSGGAVSPGLSPGTLNSGNTDWGATGVYNWEINDASGTYGSAFDKLNVTGTLSISSSSGSPFTIKILTLSGVSAGQMANFNNGQDYTWKLATASGGISGFVSNKFSLDATAIQNDLGDGYFTIYTSGNDILLKYTHSGAWLGMTVALASDASKVVGHATGLITLERWDGLNQPMVLYPAYTISLSANSSGVHSKFRDSGGVTPLVGSQIVIPNGSATVTFTYYDEKTGTWVLTGQKAFLSTGTASPNPTTAVSGAGSLEVTYISDAFTQLAFSTQPTGAYHTGFAFVHQPVVKLEDQFGNFSLSNFNTAHLTVTLTASVGSLTGTATADIGTAAGVGVGTFSGLAPTAPGGTTLHLIATPASGPPPVNSADFTIEAQASLLTSSVGSSGVTNGAFFSPKGVAVTTDGSFFYVADAGNNRIQKFDTNLTWVATWGGTNSGAGPGTFNNPSGVAVDSSGNVFVADTGNNQVQKYDGTTWTIFATGFNAPFALAADHSGNILVADTGNNKVVKLSSAGAVVTSFGTAGNGAGQFSGPQGVAVDGVGNVFVADTGNNRVEKFDGTYNFVTQFGSAGNTPGLFQSPIGIVVTTAGNINVVDQGNNKVQSFSPSDLSFSTEFGGLNGPSGIGAAPNGTIYVADTLSSTIAVFTPSDYAPATTLITAPGLGDSDALYVTDLNNDGFQDVAVANGAGRNINVFLGNGDGTFAAAVPFTVGNNPSSIAMGDFDGNGKRDLVVANQGDDTLSILLGTGSHSLWNFTTIYTIGLTAGSSPQSVVVSNPGDGFSSNPKQDILVANFGRNSISLLTGNGDGTFQTPVEIPVTGVGPTTSPSFVTVGRFDSDTFLDAITANSGDNSVTVLFGNGAGGFSSSTAISVAGSPIALATGSLYRSAFTDVAVLCNSDNTVKILKNNGNGTFSTGGTYSVGNNPRSIVAVALSNPLILDLVVANYGDSTVSVLHGNGDGTFKPAVNYPVGLNPAAVAVRNVNAGSKPDIITGDINGVTLLLDSPPDAFTTTASMLEDGGSTSVTLTGVVYNGPIEFVVTSLPPHGSIKDGATAITAGMLPYTMSSAVVTYTPTLNFFGADTFNFEVSDGLTTSDPAVATITVTAVNDAPTFTLSLASVTVAEGAPLSTFTVATSISSGPGEPNQNPAFVTDSTTINSGNLTFATAPTISTAGVLSFKPTALTFGQADYAFHLHDNGGTANGGVDSSAVTHVLINVTHANQAPFIGTISNVAVLENGTTNFNISVTDIDSTLSGMTVTATSSSNPAIIATSGVTANYSTSSGTTATFAVSVTPIPGAVGSVTIQLTANDNDTTTLPHNLTTNRSFTVTVVAVNQAPSFTKGPDQIVGKNSGAVLIPGWATALNKGGTNETGQILTFHASNNNPSLFGVQPLFNNGTADLRFTPANNMTGTAMVSVYVTDNGGTANGGHDTSATSTFVIKVRQWAPSDLLVADSSTVAGHGGLLDVKTNAGTQVVLIPSSATFRPSGVAQLSGGDLVVVDSVNHRVTQHNQYTLASNVVSTAFTAPFEMVADASDNLFVVDGSTVYELVAPGYASPNPILTSPGTVTGIAIDASGNLYVAALTTTGSVTRALAPGFGSTSTIFNAPSGVVPGGLAFQTQAPNYTYLIDTRVNGAGGINSNVIQIDGSGNPYLLTGTPFVDPEAIGYDPISGDLFVTDWGAHSPTVFTDRKVLRVHIAGPTATTISSAGSFDSPAAIIVGK